MLEAETLPAAVVDLDALDRNVDRVVASLGNEGPTLRVASKSVRHPGVLRRILDRGGPRLQGILCMRPEEAALLADVGFDDLLVAYPVARPRPAGILADLAARGVRVWGTVDDPTSLAILAAAARERGTTVDLCIDVDLSWRPWGGAAHLGVRRSPVRTPADALALAAVAAETRGVRITAVLAYEAQIAGVRDHNPGSRALDPVRRLIKRRSRPLVLRRRAAVVRALREAGHAITVVNGGGTGSVSFTAGDPSVTEVSAGSGFFCPHLFDGTDGMDLEPAAFFALPVVRRSDPDHVTCFGGGYIASGAPGADRSPVVHSPRGWAPVGLEGFGEVQTPLRRIDGPMPALGDPVICRHAKAGELAEHFDAFVLIRGDRIEAREPTYRGMGAGRG